MQEAVGTTLLHQGHDKPDNPPDHRTDESPRNGESRAPAGNGRLRGRARREDCSASAGHGTEATGRWHMDEKDAAKV